MTAPDTAREWDELGGVDGVPHGLSETIMMSGPFNFPPISVQDRTHGAPASGEGHGRWPRDPI